MALRFLWKEEREEYAFGFKHIEFRMTVIHPSGNICQAVETFLKEMRRKRRIMRVDKRCRLEEVHFYVKR